MFLLVPAHPGSPGQRAIKMLFYVELYQTNRVSDSVEAFSYFHIFYSSVKVFCIFFMKLEHTCMMWILFMISLCSHILCSDLTAVLAVAAAAVILGSHSPGNAGKLVEFC